MRHRLLAILALTALILGPTGCGKSGTDGPTDTAPGTDLTDTGTEDTGSNTDTGTQDTGGTAETQVVGELPLFDGHSHFMPTWDSDALPKLVAEHGTLGMVLLGTGKTILLQQEQPEIFSAFAHIRVTSELEQKHDKLFADLVEQLDAGARGIGELSIRHFATGPPGSLPTEWEFNHPFFLKVFDEAAKRGVPVNFHFDYDSAHLGPMNDTLPLYPTVNFIWAHSGDTDPTNLESLLAAHDNLYLDISCRNPLPSFNRPFPVEEQRMDEADGTLKKTWRELIEKYSDRIIFGSDIGPPGRLEEYAKILEYYRAVLSQLDPEIAAKVASKNALSVYGLK